MPDALGKVLADALTRDAALRRAYADLRETCAWAVDPRRADRDLVRLIERYAGSKRRETAISPRFDAVLARLPEFAVAAVKEKKTGCSLDGLLAEGAETLLRDELGASLFDSGVRMLDPWAGEGEVLSAFNSLPEGAWANMVDPAAYLQAAKRLGASFEGLCLAHSLRLRQPGLARSFSFTDDENTQRIEAQVEQAFALIATDLRHASRSVARAVRWMAARLSPRGVLAFVSDEPVVDAPELAELRAWMEGEFGRIFHVAATESLGVTFLVRGPTGSQIRYGEAATSFHAVEWRELHPTAEHVWRTEILCSEWAGFLPLVRDKGAAFVEGKAAPAGKDATASGGAGSRRVRVHPFATAWRMPERRAHWFSDGRSFVVAREPFGLLAADGAIDAGFSGGRSETLLVADRVPPEALRRFRKEYGAGMTAGDAFLYALALLHHREYPVLYREDLRRSLPRLPLLETERLAVLADAPGAPSVGAGEASGTVWLDEASFEAGTVPDYDDPFASPYARADVDAGFLLLVGLGEALYRVQTEWDRMLPSENGFEPRPSERRFGRRSLLGWASLASKRASSQERNLGQAMAAIVETDRLAGIVSLLSLPGG